MFICNLTWYDHTADWLVAQHYRNQQHNLTHNTNSNPIVLKRHKQIHTHTYETAIFPYRTRNTSHQRVHPWRASFPLHSPCISRALQFSTFIMGKKWFSLHHDRSKCWYSRPIYFISIWASSGSPPSILGCHGFMAPGRTLSSSLAKCW